ncbi:SMP-30/gluconolactonase/LRE family protein [Castellaniella sp. GW247-6E4]|uniref:SMP-30/gluconolactonase/LRE family protein n=1 Tax=Castellaniella sp. GW247-6E4 TaxID=3140380 RepID=UPI003315D159
MPLYPVIHANDLLGETPLWCDRTQSLWWLDILRPALHRLDPRSGNHTRTPFDAKHLGSLALCESGKVLLAMDLGLHLYDPETAALEEIARVPAQNRGTRLNDGRCDAHGRFWVGTMDLEYTQPVGSLYRLDPDRTVTHMASGIRLINSIAVSKDQRTLYCSDTRSHVLWAFELDAPTGTLGTRRTVAEYSGREGRPDGACIDAEGCLWVAMYAGGRILRYDPDGRLERTLHLPVTHPTCICFGGHDLRTLYITSARHPLSPTQLRQEPLAGSLLAIDLDIQGLPEARYAA